MKQSLRVVALFTAAWSVSALAWAGNYQIDPVHTKIMFKVKHLGISTVTGQFKEFSGSFELDPEDLTTLKVQTTIKAASVDTANENRDADLRSENFLGVDKYPDIRFVSTKVDNAGENRYKVRGDLTIHGVTKPVVLDAEFGGTVQDPWGNQRAAFTAETSIKRKDFGITWNMTLDSGGVVVGEDVKISLEVEGVLKKESEQ